MLGKDAAGLEGAVELLQDRFYWQQRTDVPAETATVHYFCTDQTLCYEPFYDDFGPLNLSKFWRYVQLLRAKFAAANLQGKRIVHVSSPDKRKSTNAAWLAGAYLVHECDVSPEDANDIFASSVKGCPFVPFRDASQAPSSFHLTLLDCFAGLWKAKQLQYFDLEKFDCWEYEHYEQVEHGDWNIITPKFIAFSGPSGTKTEIYPGLYSMVPSDYFDIWRKKGVGAVVRLNKKSYDSRDFTRAGFRHHDLYFIDGSCPPEPIARRFLEIAENEPGVLAIHCKAGLGRTGTLIGLYCMKHHGMTAREFIAWNRIVRPGSIIGPQQHYLCEWESKMWAEGARMRGETGVKSPATAGLGSE
eukprot:CAMPEP_0174922840 /NCGR_PEP_ID=MMETSP1355-20121228/6171_1 /TAXON_ID=464990 /ORGANISM="Hemiselmis tepida, Strain CCMP443" /LENGTH=357 /DNA_ID=CAMNT_0016168479 /DNA_START=122 /DNA_END=1192 /DNA_ORIENTATION=-